VGPSSNSLHWYRVNFDSGGWVILVDSYRVYRAELPAGLSSAEAEAAIDWESEAFHEDVVVSNVASPSHLDGAAVLIDPSHAFYYRVSGLSDCSEPYDEGALSAVAPVAP
jgi:hypothetical protein